VVAAADVRGCRLSAPAAEMLRTSGGCNVKCFDADAAIRAECDIQRTGSNDWIVPVVSRAGGVRYEPAKRKAADPNDRAVARFNIPCTAPAGAFDAAIAYSWQIRARSDSRTFAQKASVRDLFDILDDAIARIVAPRRLRIGIRLAA